MWVGVARQGPSKCGVMYVARLKGTTVNHSLGTSSQPCLASGNGEGGGGHHWGSSKAACKVKVPTVFFRNNIGGRGWGNL